MPDQLHMVLRSPYAHGRITELDVSSALTMPGVHGVYTAQDITQLDRVGRSLKMPMASPHLFRGDRFWPKIQCFMQASPSQQLGRYTRPSSRCGGSHCPECG